MYERYAYCIKKEIIMYDRHLEIFIEVAESGSFSKAAEKLYISPTAVIKQMNLLESDTDLRLFRRTHRGIFLTEEGKSLLSDAKYIIEYSKESIDRAKKAHVEAEKIIRIGTSLMTPSKFLIEMWPKIKVLHEELKFQLVSFENTPENAREILANFGLNIDLVAGIFDEKFESQRGCSTIELYKAPICCAVSINHPLAEKESLDIEDIYGERLMIIKQGWNSYVDELRADLIQNHPLIGIQDFDFYNVDIFNQCENSNYLLMAIDGWENIHPLLKIIPVNWSHKVPFGLMFSKEPESHVKLFIETVSEVF